MSLRCVDASFVVAWLVPDQRSTSVMERWSAYAEGKDEFVAPPFMYVETISAIRSLTSRGLLTPKEGLGLVEDFLALNIATSTPPGLYRYAYDLAVRYGHSKAYDACYLALADLLSCQLLTLDERLYNAVSRDFPLTTLVTG